MKKIISYKFKCKKIKSGIEKQLLLQASVVRSIWNKFVEINVNKLSKGEKYLPFNYKSFTFLRDNAEECNWWKQGAANYINYILHTKKDIFKPFVDKNGLLKPYITHKEYSNLSSEEKKKVKGQKCILRKGVDKKLAKNPNYRVKITDYSEFPQFHSYKDHCSFKGDLSGGGFKVDLTNSRVHFSKVDGWIPFIKHRRIEGTIKNVGIKKEGKNWYVNIQTEMEVADPIPSLTNIVGADRGVAKFVTCSDGIMFDSMNFLRKSEKKMTFLQRKLSKQVKGSGRYKKTQERIRKLHAHIANSRQNYIHHVSKYLTDNYSYIALEDLKITNMSKSAKGDLIDHGKNVKAKSGLNKSILDQGWGYLKQQLDYKSLWTGGYIELVNPKYTSQTCSVCRHVSSDNRKSQSEFVCENCGHTENADVNAGKNILREGIKVTEARKIVIENSLEELRIKEETEGELSKGFLARRAELLEELRRVNMAVGIIVAAQGGTQVTEPMNCEQEVSRVQVEAEEDIQLATDVKEPELVACN